MIKLDVQEYCHKCPYFEAKVTGGPSSFYSTDGEVVEIIMADTVIRCTRAEKCAWVVEESLRCRKGEPQGKGEECCE